METIYSKQRPISLLSGAILMAAVCCLLCLSACQRDIDSAGLAAVNKLTVLSKGDKNFVSLDEAKQAASQFGHSARTSPSAVNVQSVGVHTSALSTSGLPTNRSIQSIIPYPSAGIPSYYIINYAGTGFIILAADKRVEPILAYSDRNQFRLADDMPGGLVTWLTKNHQNMQTLRSDTNLKRPPIIAYLWEKLLADSSLSVHSAQPAITPASEPRVNVQQPPPAPCQNFDYPTKTYGPLLAVEWGQGCTYNDYCPVGSNGCGNHLVTGCVPTAIAQIAQFTHIPTGYAYSSMPTNSGNSDVAHLMRDIGSAVGTIYTSNNESQTPGTDYTSGLRMLGYSAASFGPYDYNTVFNNIYSGWPVLLNGFPNSSTSLGHTWVCDGIQVQSSFNCDCQCVFSIKYMHMNWGWNEYYTSQNGNGWFYQSNWTVTNDAGTYNYQYNNSMNYNLHQ